MAERPERPGEIEGVLRRHVLAHEAFTSRASFVVRHATSRIRETGVV